MLSFLPSVSLMTLSFIIRAIFLCNCGIFPLTLVKPFHLVSLCIGALSLTIFGLGLICEKMMVLAFMQNSFIYF
jgi:hypothetical protein